MLTELYIEALLVDEKLADMVWDAWDAGPISDIVAAWSRLDEFEGNEYERILEPVEAECGLQIANIYALREEMERDAL